jgi:Fis family transcriptional regulator
MARYVRKTLKEYFRDLDGEEPCCGMYDMVIDCVEKPLLEMTLEHAGGNLTRASELLGINRNTLRKKMQRHGIE